MTNYFGSIAVELVVGLLIARLVVAGLVVAGLLVADPLVIQSIASIWLRLRLWWIQFLCGW